MIKILVGVFLLVIADCSLMAQNSKPKFVVIELQIKRKGTMHQYDRDYWILQIDKWKNHEPNAILPLYFEGYSQNDLNECIETDTAVFFNYSKKDAIELDNQAKRNQNVLALLLEKHRRKVMIVEKKWTPKFKETISIYITPIVGDLKFCVVKHYIKKEIIFDSIAMPTGNFLYDEIFWGTEVSSEITKYDFSKIDPLFLHNVN